MSLPIHFFCLGCIDPFYRWWKIFLVGTGYIFCLHCHTVYIFWSLSIAPGRIFWQSFSVHMCLDSSVSFLLLVRRNELMWFPYLSLKLVASPMYDSVVVAVVTVAWSATFVCRHFRLSRKGKWRKMSANKRGRPSDSDNLTTATESYKDRYRKHMSSFRRTNRRNETELSKCKPYDNVSRKGNLCITVCW